MQNVFKTPTRPEIRQAVMVALRFVLPIFAGTAWTYVALSDPAHGIAGAVLVYALLFLLLLAPFCWLMPLKWRKAHLAAWLACTVAGFTANSLTIHIRVGSEIWIMAVLGLLIFSNGVLAVYVKQKQSKSIKDWFFLLSSFLPAAGVYITLCTWSGGIAERIMMEIKSVSQGRPYCIASNGKAVKNLSMLDTILRGTLC